MLRWPGNFVHFVFVAIVTTVSGVVYLVGRFGTLFVWNRERRARAVGAVRGWVLRQAMTTLGVTFVKIGQVMSTRPDLFSGPVIDQLRRLQDRMPPVAFWRVRRVIESELGPVDEHFSELDRTPVAAASVAQVHRGRLRDGTEVAVKVLRPGVRRHAQRDAAFLLLGAKLLALSPTLRLSDPVGHMKEFVDAIIDQTDLRLEAKNYKKFRANFDGEPGVEFPEVFEDYCGERVLTMSFLRGAKVDELPESIDRLQVAAHLRNMFLKMCFSDGFLHADLHPGNMLIDDNGAVCVFDAGLAKELAEDILLQFIDMSKCLSMGDAGDIVEHLRRFHTYLPEEIDWDEVREDASGFAEQLQATSALELDYGDVANEMFAFGRRHKIRPLPDLMMVTVALVTAQGISKQIDPDSNPFAETAKYLMPILMQRGETIPERAATADPLPASEQEPS